MSLVCEKRECLYLLIINNSSKYSIIKKIWVLANIPNHHQGQYTKQVKYVVYHKSKWHHSSVLSATFVINNDASVDDDSHKISQNVSPNTIYLVVVCVPRLITLLNDCLNHLHTKIGLIVVPSIHRPGGGDLKVILFAATKIDQKAK